VKHSVLFSQVSDFTKMAIFFVAENQMFFPRFSQILFLKNRKKISTNFLFFFQWYK
jgi:hypothetical protein